MCECDYCQNCGNEIEIYDLCSNCYEGQHFTNKVTGDT